MKIQLYVREKSFFIKNYLYYTSRQGRKWIMSELKDKFKLISNVIKEIELEDNDENL